MDVLSSRVLLRPSDPGRSQAFYRGCRSATSLSSTTGSRPPGVRVLREPRQEAWGLLEAWLADPDGVRIVLVQVPEDHPLRRDQR
ncbi:MAG: hypothetical protein M3P93_03215 [Actinomycetota bacterium]|nr:hypothetical protein [Actinomycetota bacterium]